VYVEVGSCVAIRRGNRQFSCVFQQAGKHLLRHAQQGCSCLLLAHIPIKGRTWAVVGCFPAIPGVVPSLYWGPG
jgi:hypothetical protein